MTINSINYEAFALDYIEGNLPTEVREEMELFLAKHPTIATELEEMKGFVVLEKKPVVYPHKKELLKREVDQPIHLSFYWKIASIAALFLLMVSAYFLFPDKGQVIPNNGYVQESTPLVKDAQDKALTEAPTMTTVPATNQAINKGNNKQSETSNVKAIVATASKSERPQKTILNPIQTIPNNLKTETVSNTELRINNYASQQNPKANTLQSASKKVDPIKKEIVVIALLPSLQQQEIAYNNTVKLPLAQLHQQSLSGMVASTTSKRKSIKSLLGKLPIKVEKSSFIPTFFTEEGAGQ